MELMFMSLADAVEEVLHTTNDLFDIPEIQAMEQDFRLDPDTEQYKREYRKHTDLLLKTVKSRKDITAICNHLNKKFKLKVKPVAIRDLNKKSAKSIARIFKREIDKQLE